MSALTENDLRFVKTLSHTSTVMKGSTRDTEVAEILKSFQADLAVYCERLLTLTRGGQTTKLLYLIHQIDATVAPYASVALLNFQKDRLPEASYDMFITLIEKTCESLPSGSVFNNGNMLFLLSEIWKKFYEISYRTNGGVRFVNTTNMLLSKMREVYAFTSIHWHFVDACVELKLYDTAVRGLGEYFPLRIDKEMRVHYQAFLNYFTGLASCYIRTRRYKQALLCCNELITMPAYTITEEMVLAVRRAKLLSLIVHNKPYEFPRQASRDLKDSWTRSDSPFLLRNNCYVELNRAFTDLDSERIKLLFAEHLDELKQCGDSDELLTEVNKAVILQSIKNITVTYLSMTLEDIRVKARLQNIIETEKLVSELILSGVIKAKINKRSNVVHFTDFGSGESDIDFEKLRVLAEKTEICLSALAKIRCITASTLSSPDYVKKHAIVVKEDGTPVGLLGATLKSAAQSHAIGVAGRDMSSFGEYGHDDSEAFDDDH